MHPVDRQHTLHELQLLPENSRSASILAFYDHTATLGGADYLYNLLNKLDAFLAMARCDQL